LFFTIRGHSDHFEERSGCSEHPMKDLSSYKPDDQVPPYTCICEVRRGKRH
jgi:hypothetical protein